MLQTEGQERVPTAPAAGGELRFQRCRWCRTSVFRRSLCPTCGSTDLAWELSAGTGVVVRRNTPAAYNTSLVTMDEGFTLVCRITGASPEAVCAGVRVRVVDAVDTCHPNLPVVELCDPPLRADAWR